MVEAGDQDSVGQDVERGTDLNNHSSGEGEGLRGEAGGEREGVSCLGVGDRIYHIGRRLFGRNHREDA